MEKFEMLRRIDEKHQEGAHMGQSFKGSQDELEAIVREGGFTGDWATDSNGRVEFRSGNGAVLNWWPNSKAKTLNVQGAKDSDSTFAILGPARAAGHTAFG